MVLDGTVQQSIDMCLSVAVRIQAAQCGLQIRDRHVPAKFLHDELHVRDTDNSIPIFVTHTKNLADLLFGHHCELRSGKRFM